MQNSAIILRNSKINTVSTSGFCDNGCHIMLVIKVPCGIFYDNQFALFGIDFYLSGLANHYWKLIFRIR